MTAASFAKAQNKTATVLGGPRIEIPGIRKSTRLLKAVCLE